MGWHNTKAIRQKVIASPSARKGRVASIAEALQEFASSVRARKQKPSAADILHIPIGTLGENAAADYLKSQGLQIIRRNWRCKAGEIDIIAQDSQDLVFVEVKSRLSSRRAKDYLFENIDYRKSQKLRLLANIYLAYYFSRKSKPHRIDIVGVIFCRNSRSVLSIEHLKGAL
jgi:putative endonuclease